MDVKEAVQVAAVQLANLMNVPQEKFLLEKVERFRENGASYWGVTFSYPARAEPGLGALSALRGLTREYKTVQLDAETGEFKAIKMRALAE